MKKYKIAPVPIPEFSENYSVDVRGNVYSLHNSRGNLRKKKHKLSPNMGTHGYCIVHLYKDSERKVFLIHRLVALAFVRPVNGKTYVNHKDGVKTNNNVKNLEWCTIEENNLHTKNILKRSMGARRRGKPNAGTAKPVIRISVMGEKVKFARLQDAAASVGITKTQLYYALNIGKNFAAGHTWVYA